MNPSDSVAYAYYQKWLSRKFPTTRAYIIAILGTFTLSFMFSCLVAIKTEEPFSWAIPTKLAVLFSCFCCIFILIARWAGTNASWLIANRALALLKSKHPHESWDLLARRYRDIHPLVINDAAFKEILNASLTSIGHGAHRTPVPLSDFAKEGPLVGATAEATKRAKTATRIMLWGFILAIILSLIRMMWR